MNDPLTSAEELSSLLLELTKIGEYIIKVIHYPQSSAEQLSSLLLELTKQQICESGFWKRSGACNLVGEIKEAVEAASRPETSTGNNQE